MIHDDIIKWKHFLCYWPFGRGIHRWPVNIPCKGQWCGALMFSLICSWINDWVNNCGAGDLKRHCAHYDVILIIEIHPHTQYHSCWCISYIAYFPICQVTFDHIHLVGFLRNILTKDPRDWRLQKYIVWRVCRLIWGGWGCEVSCVGHHRPRGKTTTGSALNGAVFDITQILAYLVHNMSRSQLYLGFGHFGWLLSFFAQ